MSSSTVLLFADDTKCSHPISYLTDCHSLQQDINQLSMWSNLWNLHFNPDKCALMRFTFREQPVIFNYHINNSIISCKTLHRDLGLLMSDNLCWEHYYKSILAKAYKTLHLLRRTFHNMHCNQAKKCSLLIPSEVATAVLLTCLASTSDQRHSVHIENVRRATKFILNDFSSDYKHGLISLKLLPLMMQLELNELNDNILKFFQHQGFY